jgi:hypothetical protein
MSLSDAKRTAGWKIHDQSARPVPSNAWIELAMDRDASTFCTVQADAVDWSKPVIYRQERNSCGDHPLCTGAA